MPTLANVLNTDLKRGFTVPQVAEKHGWPEPLVWSVALEGKDDLQIFKALNWGLQSWDVWNFNDCDRRFEIYTARLSITGNRQLYLPVEIQKMLEGSGKIRIQILGG